MIRNASDFEVIIIGAGNAGTAVAQTCAEVDLPACTIDPSATGVTYSGRGFVAGPNSVAMLNPQTGDETKLLHAPVIIIATGSRDGIANTAFLGLRKLGIETDPTTGGIFTDAYGRTTCATVFAVGSCCKPRQDSPSAAAITAAILALHRAAVITGSFE
ncbi:MAG: FAD-dependent oxidoreductase [Candidatus Sumerlaeaceae bacterium]